jgi:hypothetical protein
LGTVFTDIPLSNPCHLERSVAYDTDAQSKDLQQVQKPMAIAIWSLNRNQFVLLVIPAKAGIQLFWYFRTPACAGVTVLKLISLKYLQL